MNEYDMVKQEISITDIAVAVLFHEKVEQTIQCIESFLPSHVSIYVLNNASSKSSFNELEKYCAKYKQVRIFNSKTNLGVGVGRNYLISNTSEKWLLFVDNDIVVNTPNWFEKIRDHILAHPEIEAFIPKLYDLKSEGYIQHRAIDITNNKVIFHSKIKDKSLNTFSGGASFVNRSLFDRLGLYDEKMFVGFEDYELSIRATLGGNPIRARLIDDIELLHNPRMIAHEKDKDSFLVRYDLNLHEASYNRMAEKYPDLDLGDWIGLSIADLPYNWKSRFFEKAANLTTKNDKILNRYWKSAPPRIKNRIKKIYMGETSRSMPLYCGLYMTDKCNFKCTGCSRQIIGVRKTKDMSLNVVKKALSVYPSIRSLSLAGLGEPTLCKEFETIVNYLKKIDKHVEIVTNGFDVEKLLHLDCKPDWISISLYGYDEESYLRLAGVDAFQAVVDNYYKLINKFDNVGFFYYVQKDKIEDLQNVVKSCDKIKPKYLQITNYIAYNPTVEENVSRIITVRDDKIIHQINQLFNKREYITVKPVYPDFDNNTYKCRTYFRLMTIDGDGNIGGCQRQVAPNRLFGNIFKDADPFNSPVMRQIRYNIKNRVYPHFGCRYCFGNWA